MNAHVSPTWPSEGDAFDEVDRIEARAQPTAADLERLDVLAHHPSSLAAMMARTAAQEIRSRAVAESAGAASSIAGPAAPASIEAGPPSAPSAADGATGQGGPAKAPRLETRPARAEPAAEQQPATNGPAAAPEAEQQPAGEAGSDAGLMDPTPAPIALDLPRAGEEDEVQPAKDPALEALPSDLDQVITFVSPNGEANDMAQGKFVSYVRVSTERQGRSGLGLDAQRSAVTAFLNGSAWTMVGEFVEVESGAKDDRPQLAAAMALCRVHGATLLIAKLDRLSRDAAFLMGLQKAGVRFVAADMPEANETMVGFMALMAQAERKAIGARTKAALAEAKKRGVVMGGFRGYVPSEANRQASADVRTARAVSRGADLAPILREMQSRGITSLGGIARALTEAGIPTARGASTWSPMQVSRVLKAAGHGT